MIAPLFCVTLLSSSGGLTLADGRVSLGVLTSLNVDWRAVRTSGLVTSNTSLTSRLSLVTLDAELDRTTAVRLGVDLTKAAPQSVRELFVQIAVTSGWGCRLGRFMPPLGFEAAAEPSTLKFIDYSLISWHWKPSEPWDFGAMGFYEGRCIYGALALVNGSSEPFSDDNRWRDVCFRFALLPESGSWPDVGVRYYHGMVGEIGSPFSSAASDVRLGTGVLTALGEFEYASYLAVRWYSSNLQVSYALTRFLEPTLRVQGEARRDGTFGFGFVPGVLFSSASRALSAKVNVNYWHDVSRAPGGSATEVAIMLEIMAHL